MLKSENIRTIFLSDLHVGWHHSNPQLAIELLRSVRPDFLYLVGDTFEWKHRHYSRKSQREVRETVLVIQNLMACGTEVALIAGNHDCRLSEQIAYLGIPTAPSAIHELSSGKRLLVIHGDVFDLHNRRHQDKASVRIAGWAYPYLVQLENHFQQLKRTPRDSLSSQGNPWKLRISAVRKYVAAFESFMIELARAHNCDGVVCGHIHVPVHKTVDGTTYLNCGDWIDNRSLAVEHFSGQLGLTVLLPHVKEVSRRREEVQLCLD